MERTFCWYQNFWPSGLDLDFDLLLEKLEFVAAGGISPVRTDPDLVDYSSATALDRFWQNLTGGKYSTSSTFYVFHEQLLYCSLSDTNSKQKPAFFLEFDVAEGLCISQKMCNFTMCYLSILWIIYKCEDIRFFLLSLKIRKPWSNLLKWFAFP